MYFKAISKNTGLTFIEVIIVVAIIVVILTIVGASFGRVSGNQELKRGASLVRSVLDDSRTRTISSKEASNYGVHIAADAVTLFKGSSYSSSDPENEEVSVPSRVILSSSISGGSDVVFERLTGATSNTGTVTVSLKDGSGSSKIISVQASGLISSE